MAKAKPLHKSIRALFEASDEMTDAELLKRVKVITSQVCKPCWELRYCPYGPLVEDFPPPPADRVSSVEHNEYLKSCLETGTYGEDAKPLDAERRAFFQASVDRFDPDDYPDTPVPTVIEEMGCRVFGHMCPVFFVSEGFTETTATRRSGRYIPAPMKMRVARRDNYMCQESGCGRSLRDFEIEFDHIIPVSKGGPTVEHNLRVTCFEHNRGKGARMEL